MKIQIHQGGSQIGGNCVEIFTDKTRIILDVGIPLDDMQPDAKPSEPPNVPGLFADGPRIDAILLSHAHGDHTGLLKKTREEIPVHCIHTQFPEAFKTLVENLNINIKTTAEK